MARPRTLANVRRDDQIYALWIQNQDPAAVAERFAISPRRVLQIVAARNPEIEQDVDRAIHRGRLEILYEQVQDIINAPGYKLAPNGRFAQDENGDAVPDVGAKIEAAKVQLSVLESMRRLNATDKPQRSIITHDVAEQQKNDFLARVAAKRAEEVREMEELRRQASVIPGEVVRELQAGISGRNGGTEGIDGHLLAYLVVRRGRLPEV